MDNLRSLYYPWRR